MSAAQAFRSLAILVAVTLSSITTAALGPSAAPADPQRLPFILQYVGTDYAGAVSNGAVSNPAEYGEVLRLARELHDACDPARCGGELADALRDLQQLIVDRAPADQVWSSTRRLLPALSRVVGAESRPPALPDVGNGQRLWRSDCAPCHGSTGAGDGPAAGDLTPPPTAFRGDYLERLSPRQVYDAVSLGVPGTAMPSYIPAYSAQQRWDVAFYVMTLRVDFEPRRPPADVHLALEELAAMTGSEILARLREQHPEVSEREVDYLRVNLVSPDGEVIPLAGSDAAAGGALPVALQLQDTFARIADRVFPFVVGVSGYERAPEWSPEALRRQRGDSWMAANAELVRYPGYRPLAGGSGIVFGADGYVLSCDHLLRDEQGEVVPLVDIELADQSHALATVVGTEPTIDLAVLRLTDLTAVSLPDDSLALGDSDRLLAGHWVIGIGDPPGPERIFQVGTVSSGPQRQCYQERLSATALQTSLTIPAGGLGGPVVDILGHVVGISVRPSGLAAASSLPGAPAAGASFTLPINLVQNLFEALRVSQSTRSPWLGISVLELQALARRKEAAGLTPPSSGLYIDDVFEVSPASRAGVRPGDFLLALGGRAIRSVADFQVALYESGIGTTVDLSLQRDGQPLHVHVPIEVRPVAAHPR